MKFWFSGLCSVSKYKMKKKINTENKKRFYHFYLCFKHLKLACSVGSETNNQLNNALLLPVHIISLFFSNRLFKFDRLLLHTSMRIFRKFPDFRTFYAPSHSVDFQDVLRHFCPFLHIFRKCPTDSFSYLLLAETF